MTWCTTAFAALLCCGYGQLEVLQREASAPAGSSAEVRQLFAGARDRGDAAGGVLTAAERQRLAEAVQPLLESAPPEALDEVAAVVLLEAARFASTSPETAHRFQQMVADRLLFSSLSKVKARGDLPAAFAEIDRFEATAAKLGVPPSHAAVVRLNVISRLWAAGWLDEPQRQLSLCSDVAADDSVWPEFRAGYWNLRAVVAAAHGHYAEAYACYDRALDIYHRLGSELLEATIHMNLADLSVNLGDYAGAQRELARARDTFSRAEADLTFPAGSRQVATTNRLITEIHLARLSSFKGNAGDALTRLQHVQKAIAALQRDRASATDDGTLRPIEAFALVETGMCHYGRGRYADARRSWERAWKLYEGDPQNRALVEVNLGWCDFTTGDVAGAAEYFASALQNLPQARRPEAQCYLARAQEKLGNLERAGQLLQQALDASEAAVNATLRTALSERDRQAYLLKLRSHTEQSIWPGVFDTYLELAPRLRMSARAQYGRVLRWKGILTQYSNADASAPSGEERTRLVAEREGLVRNIRALAVAARHLEQRARLTPSDEEDLRTLRETIRAREQEVARIERGIRSIDSASQTPVLPALEVDEVAAILTDRTALLDIVVTSSFRVPEQDQPGPRHRTVGFLVDHSGNVSRVELGDADPIAQQTQEFTEAITLQRPVAESREQLDALIGRPIQKHLPQIDLLYVSGDGWVHRVPLGALSGARREYWIEELAFAQVASAHSLVRRQRQPKRSSGALLVGGLDYGPGRGRVWPYLLGTWLESQRVQAQLREQYPQMDVNWLVARRCDKETLCRELRTRRIVHLATHGFFEERESELGGIYDISAQMDSGLVLSNANLDLTTGEQYVLTAEELGREDLSGIDLLVLSACNTGLGHLSHGEGIIGLLGALDRAGVRCVVSALWEVDDAVTMKLMEAFYRHCLKEDLAHPAQAMRQAQIEMLRGHIDVDNRVDEELQRPYFWAAWTVMGWSG